MLSAARGLTDPLACDPVTDLVGPSGFKINGGRVSGLPQGVFVGGDSLPKVEGRGDRFDPETEVRPAPGQPLAPAVGYPQHRVLEVFRIPFDGDAVATAWGADRVEIESVDALGRPIRSAYALAGIELVAPEDRNVAASNTFGLVRSVRKRRAGREGDPHRHRGFGDERRGRGNPRTRHPQGVPDPHRLRCGRRPRPGFADLGVHARNPDLGRGLLPGALERQEGRRARARRGCRRAGHGRREAHDR